MNLEDQQAWTPCDTAPQKISNQKSIIGHQPTTLRSTSCAQWLGLTRHTHPWKSTFAGRCSRRKEWSRQSSKLLGHALTNASKHCGATRENHIAVEVFADV